MPSKTEQQENLGKLGYILGFNNSGIVNIEDNSIGTKMLDKFARVSDDRRIEPLNQFENIDYEHRYYYDEYNLLIGDCYFMIPPEFIMVSSESPGQNIVTLRQENSQKIKSGYHKRTIMIDLVFNGLDQINGFPVDGPEGTYYVDGLRQLLAQFKCTPFLPISNDLINNTYNIHTVALQSIVIRTIDGFANCMSAQITLQEITMFPYLQVPDILFRNMIDWDLFRYYYQRFLTENHTYKKLQSLPNNKNHNHFKLSILDECIFESKDATNYNMLEIICDKKIIKKIDEEKKDTTNYTTWVDSKVDNINIVSFQCGYSNLLTNIQLSELSSPTVQFMGGMDTIYNITFETTEYSVVQALEQCQITNNSLIRNNRKINSLGFVKLESELVEFTGSLFVGIDSITTNTVPGFPNLYNIQMQCIAFDISQTNREELTGFKPFKCSEKGKCGYYDKDKGFVSDHIHSDQAIEQTMLGLKTKIKQDNFAEWKLRSSIELYPDLYLPKYKEVDKVIEKITKFRKDNNLYPLPYTKYPKAPFYTLGGLNPNNKYKIKYMNNKTKDIVNVSEIDDFYNSYEGYVDPDFYVFYPISYESFITEEDNPYDEVHTPFQRDTTSRRSIISNIEDEDEILAVSDTGSTTVSNTTLINKFVEMAKGFVTHEYVWGAEGEIKKNGKIAFDCSGLVTYCMRKLGLMKKTIRPTVRDFPNIENFKKISWDKMQKGDLLTNKDLSHIVIYIGNNKVVHASNSNPYPRGGVKISTVQEAIKNKGLCLRHVKFETTNSSTKTSGVIKTFTSGGSYAQQVWNALKSYGLSDIACAGILGNMHAESSINPTNVQNRTSNAEAEKKEDIRYTSGVDAGTISKSTFVNDSRGYGLVQFTNSTYKEELYNNAKSNKVSISDVSIQIYTLIKQITGEKVRNTTKFKGKTVLEALKSCTTVKDASTVFLKDYEKPRNMNSYVNLRASYAEKYYKQFKGTKSTVTAVKTSTTSKTTTTTNNTEKPKYTLTKSEFEAICRTIMYLSAGRTEKSEKVLAQLIYDRLTNTKKFGGLSSILNTKEDFPDIYKNELSKTIEKNVKEIFCENKKYWKDYQVWYYVTPDSSDATIAQRDRYNDRLGDIDSRAYYGEKSKGSTIKYTIIENDEQNETEISDASNNFLSVILDKIHEAQVLRDVENFGKATIIRTDALVYDNSWMPWSTEHNDSATNSLNSTRNIYLSSYCDEVQYSARGKLLRAFPTYLFAILDDNAQWFDGKKLWTNYYIYKSIVSIAVHGTNDMPTETAEIVITNTYHNLDKVQGGMASYSLEKDEEYTWLQRAWYKQTGNLLSLKGPILTDQLIKLHQVIYDHALLREGARVHLRMGYGSDPLGLAPMINGHISDISLGDQISMIVTSDGNELIQHVSDSGKSKDTNDGWLGLFGLGEEQESSNIIADILCKRQSWATYLMGTTFEGSKYSIEHFGLYFNRDIMYYTGNYFLGGFKNFGTDVADTAVSGAQTGQDIGQDIGFNIPVISDITGFLGGGIGGILGSIGGVIKGTGSLLFTWGEGINDTITDIWDSYQEQYDLLKNIYRANYKREYYIYNKAFGADKENNLIYNKFNMTPWDIFQVCTQQVPEYIVKTGYHQFDSRLYFGLPFWMEKYRYDYINGEIFEECKSASQVHFLDSMDNIIDNQIKVTSKHSYTNVKVMYIKGSTAVSTKVIHSDDTIDFSKQKTNIIDSPITQDAFGPDAVYEAFSLYKLGKESARRVGISNLLYGWQQQYQGEILLLGHPGLKAHDYLMINDTFASIFGIAIAREVVHSFNVNTGFTTSVVPGMIGFSKDDQSGMIETVQNYLSLLSDFSSYTYTRKMMRNNFEKNFALLLDTQKNVKNVYKNQKNLEIAGDISNIAAKTGSTIFTIKTIKNLTKAKGAVKIASSFVDAFKVAKGAATGIRATYTAVKAGTIAAGTTAGGIPGLVAAALFTVADVALSKLFEWLENKNVCALMPLWWEGYPFVSGTKDGEKILLTDSLANATKENTAKDAVSREE